MRRGFKTEAEQIATELRAELQLGHGERLDVLALAEHLAIPVLSLSDVSKSAPGNSFCGYFSVTDPECFSAVTLFYGTKRFIVHNNSHHPNRQASNVAHEISHTVLEHEPTPLIDTNGQRFWLPEVEDEATWLAAALLVPRAGALAMRKAKREISQISTHYGVSEELCRWRVQQCGIDKQVQRWNQSWR